MELLCLWTPGFCGIPSLHVRSPVSGPVCVLPQSTIVTLLSLLWLGLLLVFVQFHCLRLTLWASACVGPHGCPTFSRVGADHSTWVPLLWPGFDGSLPPCSFSSVFLRDVVTLWGSLVSFVTIDCQRRFPLEGFSFGWLPPISEWCRSFPMSSLSLSCLLVAGDSAFP